MKKLFIALLCIGIAYPIFAVEELIDLKGGTYDIDIDQIIANEGIFTNIEVTNECSMGNGISSGTFKADQLELTQGATMYGKLYQVLDGAGNAYLLDATVASGNVFTISNDAEHDTGDLVKIIQDHADTSGGGSVILVQDDGQTKGIFYDKNGTAGVALLIDSESSAEALYVDGIGASIAGFYNGATKVVEIAPTALGIGVPVISSNNVTVGGGTQAQARVTFDDDSIYNGFVQNDGGYVEIYGEEGARLQTNISGLKTVLFADGNNSRITLNPDGTGVETAVVTTSFTVNGRASITSITNDVARMDIISQQSLDSFLQFGSNGADTTKFGYDADPGVFAISGGAFGNAEFKIDHANDRVMVNPDGTGDNLCTLTGSSFSVQGNIYATGDIAGDSFTEFCNVFVGDNALDLLKQTKGTGEVVDGFQELDHTTVPDILKGKKTVIKYRNINTDEVVDSVPVVTALTEKGIEEVPSPNYEPVQVVEKGGRDLGKKSDVNSRAILELLSKIEELEARLNEIH